MTTKNKNSCFSSPELPPKRVRGNATKRLAKASQRILRDNSDQLVQTIYQRTLEGDAASGRLLLAFLRELSPSRPRKKKTPIAPAQNSGSL